MAKYKVGFNQINTPPPIKYRRWTNATILFFIPMLTGIVQKASMSNDLRNDCMIGIVSIPFLLKGIGTILGVPTEADNLEKELNENKQIIS